jgi:hypothetical protein
MKRTIPLYGIVFFIVVCVSGRPLNAVAVQELQHDEESLRALTKYSTVFRLIPARVAQMLKVVNAYPASDVVRRTDLLQLVIQRMHDMYRITQRIQNRVAEIDSVQSKGLIDALKKYQVTLISTLSVFDSEFVRSLKRSRSEGDSTGRSGSDSAYSAAKMVLRHNQMDTLIETMATGNSGIGGEVIDGSVRNEIRELRDQVSLLSSQLQSKALLSGDHGSNEKDFSHKISELTEQNAEAVREAQKSLSKINEVVQPRSLNKKRSLRHSSRSVAGVSAQPATLQAHARAAYLSTVSYLYAVGNWMYESIPYADQVWDGALALFGRVFSDTHKAISHVGTRMKEVKEIAPEGVSVATSGLWSFGEWIIESWIRIGHYALTIAGPVSVWIGEQWCLVVQKCSRFDTTMRTFACQIVTSVAAYRVWLWDGSLVYDEDKEEEIMQPGMLKVWTAQSVSTIKQYYVLLKNRFFPAETKSKKQNSTKKDGAMSLIVTEKIVATAKIYGALMLEKIGQIYTVVVEYVAAAKNWYFPPIIPASKN